MAQDRPNGLAEWLMLVRKQLPIVREHFAAWLEAVREEPRLAWETSAVRYAAYGLAGVVSVWLATTIIGWLTPPPPPSGPTGSAASTSSIPCLS